MISFANLVALYVVVYRIRSCEGVRATGYGSELNAYADFFLGALFPISLSGKETCESVRTQIPGVEYAEAMLFSLDAINNDPNLLPGVSLGFDIRDTCSVDYVAMDEASEWVSSKITQDTCDCFLSTSQNDSSVLVGVVGAAFSKISGPVGSLFRPFDVPQISYASTSSSLNDRRRYTYFLRTVPPDSLQAQAMVDILLDMEWTVVSALHSNELYGETGMEEFRNAVDKTNICMDLDERIDEDFTPDEYFKLAQKFVDESVANVVVFFALHTFALGFFTQLSRIETDRKFLWIASDGWAESEDIQGDYYDEVAGMIELVPFNPASPEFDQYFTQLTQQTNTRNPWFQDYCDANLQEKCSPDTSVADFPDYSQDFFVPTVIDAVYSFANGLHDYLVDNCEHPIQWNGVNQSCQGQKKAINGSVLFEYITNTSFDSPTGRHIQYSEQGYVEESTYEIKNLQRNGGVTTNRVVAKWNPVNQLAYIVPQSDWQFGLTDEGYVLDTLKSECTICQPGSVTLLLPSSCCNLCTQCLGSNYSNSTTATSCSTCEEHMWGNSPLNGSEHCIPITESYLSFERPWGITLLCFQIIGLVAVAVVVFVIVAFLRRNPSIRSFGMEQLGVIFVGLVLCFLLPVFFMIKPSPVVCAFQQIFLWFSLTLIFAALLVKLVRITRIFLGSSAGLHRRFIAPGYQILFTMLIVLGQMILVGISLGVTPPAPYFFQQNDTANPNNFPELIVTCQQPHPAMLVLLVVYESVLIVLINGLAIFTIRFPKNFNESRHIAFATFAIGMIWIAFVPTYVATNNEVRFASIALAVMLMGFAVLGCLIGPRLLTAFQNYKKGEQSFSMHSKKNDFSLQGTYNKTEETNVAPEKVNEKE